MQNGEVETVAARRLTPSRARTTSGAQCFEAATADIPISRAGTVRKGLRAAPQQTERAEPVGAGGPAALWLALGQFGRATPDWRQLDAELRPWRLGSSPGVLMGGARDRGLQAQLYNRGSFFDLERETERGRGVLVMTGGAGAETSWLRVRRAWEDSTRRRWVEVETPWAPREVLRFEQFDMQWRNHRLAGLPTGYDRAYLLIDRPKAKPLPTTTAADVHGLRALTDGAQTFVRGADTFLEGRVVLGLSRALGGAILTVAGAVGALHSLPGLSLTLGGDALLDLARVGFDRGGLHVLVGAVAGAAGLAVRGVGMIASSVGNALGLLGQGAGAMVQGALSALATAVR